MIKLISLFLLCAFSSIGHASYTFHITDDVNSEKFQNKKGHFIKYWMNPELKIPKVNQIEILEVEEEFTKKQKEQHLEKTWNQYLKESGQYFICAEDIKGDSVAFVFYTATQRQTEGKDEKKWAFLSGYAICEGQEDKEEAIIPLLLENICKHAQTPRIMTGTAKTNKIMKEKLTKFKFEEEKFEKKVKMSPNWFEKYPPKAVLYYKIKI